MNQTSTYHTLPVSDLAELAAKYEEKWPEIRYAKGGSRAQKAMTFVVEGRIWQEPNDRYGHDVWTVNGNRCSREGKWCECEDRIRTDIKYGKLCSHRLAVALKTNWLGDKHPALADALAALIVEYGQAGQVTLIIDRQYGWREDGERFALAGGYNGKRRDKWPANLRIEFNLPQLQTSLSAVGWSIAGLPEKLPNEQDYLYFIQEGEGLALTPEIFYFKSRTGQMIERERSRKMILGDIARNLPELLAGPLQLNLSTWEAKRVLELRAEMQRQEATAGAVWSRLPAEVRAAILEHATQENLEEVFA